MKKLLAIGLLVGRILKRIGNAVFPMLSVSLDIKRHEANAGSEKFHLIALRLEFGWVKKNGSNDSSPGSSLKTQS